MPSKTLTLTGEQAREFAWDGGDPELGLTVEANFQTGTRRWDSVHRLVLKDKDGRLWAATYRQGLTENQDSSPFDYETVVTFREVEKVPVTSYEYREIGSEKRDGYE